MASGQTVHKFKKHQSRLSQIYRNHPFTFVLIFSLFTFSFFCVTLSKPQHWLIYPVPLPCQYSRSWQWTKYRKLVDLCHLEYEKTTTSSHWQLPNNIAHLFTQCSICSILHVYNFPPQSSTVYMVLSIIIAVILILLWTLINLHICKDNLSANSAFSSVNLHELFSNLFCDVIKILEIKYFLKFLFGSLVCNSICLLYMTMKSTPPNHFILKNCHDHLFPQDHKSKISHVPVFSKHYWSYLKLLEL